MGQAHYFSSSTTFYPHHAIHPSRCCPCCLHWCFRQPCFRECPGPTNRPGSSSHSSRPVRSFHRWLPLRLPRLRLCSLRLCSLRLPRILRWLLRVVIQHHIQWLQHQLLMYPRFHYFITMCLLAASYCVIYW